MQERQLTLDQYAAEIVRPMVLGMIASGRLDNTLTDPDVLLIALKDEEMKAAVIKRLKYLYG